jgi:hypothetical protein
MLLDILYLREKPYRRETKLLGLLQFIAGPVWRTVFGRSADLSESPEEYFIIDKQLILNKYISPPPGHGVCDGLCPLGLHQPFPQANNHHGGRGRWRRWKRWKKEDRLSGGGGLCVSAKPVRFSRLLLSTGHRG